jgi:natural product biosynthesis luciferase-like monooxygenase protein
VLAAALAMVTRRVRLRAGSVVLPLHHPLRVAEEWAVVDNLSAGRVDLAFATGWNPNDFVFAPAHYAERRDVLFEGIKTVHALWRGEAIELSNGVGEPVAVRVHPLPMQERLSVWITCSGGSERFVEAGRSGANVLTALLFQSVEELAEKVAAYRAARAQGGHDPATGRVTLMLHTCVGDDLDAVRRTVREPFLAYLESSVDLWRTLARRKPDQMSAAERRDLLDYAFERYWRTSALFGTPTTCLSMIERLRAVGVDEIACLIDFGVPVDAVLANLVHLDALRRRVSETLPPADLLAAVDHLSDAQVDALLRDLLAREHR